jgi:hypothetical protein
LKAPLFFCFDFFVLFPSACPSDAAEPLRDGRPLSSLVETGSLEDKEAAAKLAPWRELRPDAGALLVSSREAEC